MAEVELAERAPAAPDRLRLLHSATMPFCDDQASRPRLDSGLGSRPRLDSGLGSRPRLDSGLGTRTRLDSAAFGAAPPSSWLEPLPQYGGRRRPQETDHARALRMRNLGFLAGGVCAAGMLLYSWGRPAVSGARALAERVALAPALRTDSRGQT